MCIEENLGKVIKKENKSQILNDIFWEKIENFHKLLQPLGEHIIKIEGNTPLINTVADIFADLQVFFENTVAAAPVLKQEEQKIKDFLQNRRAFCVKPIHLAANLLDPKTFGKSLKAGEDIEAIEFMFKIATRTVDIDEDSFMTELTQFRAKEGIFEKDFLWHCANKISALCWWKSFCSTSTPNLHNMALKILGAPATSAACERSFSKYSNIQCAKKNKLHNDRASKLLFVSENINLLNSGTDTKTVTVKSSQVVNETLSRPAEIEVTQSDMAVKTGKMKMTAKENQKGKITEEDEVEQDSYIDSDSILEEEDIPYDDTSGESLASVSTDEDKN